jgi:hypothetical protein
MNKYKTIAFQIGKCVNFEVLKYDLTLLLYCFFTFTGQVSIQ